MKIKLLFVLILLCVVFNSFICTVYSPSEQKTYNEISKTEIRLVYP